MLNTCKDLESITTLTKLQAQALSQVDTTTGHYYIPKNIS